MTFGRRNFLRGVVAAPFAAKQVAEQAASRLSGISIGHLAGSNQIGINQPPALAQPSNLQWLKVIDDKTLRRELESIYYERERQVSAIDPDIACLRSVSLSAKIAYQRERR
jgi:hypothetical protein